MLSFAVLFLAGCGIKSASNGDKESAPGDRKGNAPTELISACEGKTEGDTCEASMPVPRNDNRQNEDNKNAEKMSGTCKKSQDGNQLVCMSDNARSKPVSGSEKK